MIGQPNLEVQKCICIKTEHILRAVVQLVNISKCLVMIGSSKMHEMLSDMITYKMLLDVTLGLGLRCLSPLSTKFQLYCGG